LTTNIAQNMVDAKLNMKIVYVGHDSKKQRSLIAEQLDFISLHPNNWDDYNYKTTFPTNCYMNGKEIDIGSVKILIEEEKTSSNTLDKLIDQGWDGVFPIPDIVYISTPEAISFYEQIEGHLGTEAAIVVAQTLHDASYLTKIKDDPDALRLLATNGFKNSLQRERGAIKAFLDGWKLFGKESISIGNQVFRFKSTSDDITTLDLRFESPSPLPHDINVLIGPNGVGKSQLLQQIVKSWLRTVDDASDIGFAERPNFNQVVVVSYSPFELFPVDTAAFDTAEFETDKDARRDNNVYKYFGLRGRKKLLTDSKRGSNTVTLSRDFPKANAAQSLLACLSDDQKYGGIKEWSNKVKTMEHVLKRAISFDCTAVVVDSAVDTNEFFTDIGLLDQPFVDEKFADEDNQQTIVRYLPISSDRIDELKVLAIKKHLEDLSGVAFLKDGKPIHLSSGQRLFSYIVINILGVIRRNSLILVDEPELFLHPNLEIAFIRMLKSILTAFDSKALVATHSLVTVREIPRNCVHVLENTDDGIMVKTPPFETFGGDVQRISSYIFGDKELSKPYEDWVTKQLEEHGSAKGLIEALGEDINEELLIQINAMDRDLW